jgi:hypothetical protein
MAKPSMLTVRHYCQGIGDSHLLKFRKKDGSDFSMLIDCGLHSSVTGSTATMAKVVDDIAKATGNRLDVLVVTHEHWDHVSAFLSAAEAFEKFKIGAVWMGWTENPSEDAVKELDEFKSLAGKATQRAAVRLSPGSRGVAGAVRQGLVGLSGFQFGLKGERVRKAREAAKKLASKEPKYLEPATKPFKLKGVPGIRVYVLGPPRERDLLKLTTRESEQYHFGLARGLGMARAISAAPGMDAAGSEIDYCAPFDVEEGKTLNLALANPVNADEQTKKLLYEYYSPRDQSWRRIDEDWLFAAADLAMQFDSRTNNTSLVLAFEFVDTGRVALFAADAQVGNWLSWQSLEWKVGDATVTGPDLLRRTVYLKVGHHGSENATLEAKGLELMIDPDLSAFIPTNEVDAKKVGWGRMPYDKILTRLMTKTAGRVIRSDDPWVGGVGRSAYPRLRSGSIRSISHEQDLWVEVGIA